MSHQIIELNIDDHTLAATCLNSGAAGEPVILLHGITGSITFWETNPAPYLLDVGPCYSLSLPGHFPAIAPDRFKNTPITSETLVDLLEKAIRQIIGEKTVTVIGHSTGGYAALALAAYKPQIIRRAVSIAGFTHGHWTGVLGTYQQAVRRGWLGETYFKQMYRLLMSNLALYRWALRFYAADVGALYAHPDTAEAIENSFPYFRRLDLDAVMRYFKDMPQIDITPKLACIQAKTLLITGDSDPIVSPAQSYTAAKQIKDAELAVIPGAGHFLFTERYDQYNHSLSEWLARTYSD